MESINLVLSDVSSYPKYDYFETKVSQYFNQAYFEGTCSDVPLDSFLVQWVERNCPATMSQAACALYPKLKNKYVTLLALTSNIQAPFVVRVNNRVVRVSQKPALTINAASKH